MIDTAAIATVIGLGREALRLVKDFSSKSDDPKVSELRMTIADLLDKLTDAKLQFHELDDARRTAEAKLAELQSWKDEAAKYQAVDLANGQGIFVYAQMENGVAKLPYLCPSCFDKKIKGIMNRPGPGYGSWVCVQCEHTVVERSSGGPSIVYRGPGRMGNLM